MIMNTILIVFLSTVYICYIWGIKEVYMIWICGVYFATSGVPVLFSTNTAKCFGQKHFIAIYGCLFLLLVIGVIYFEFIYMFLIYFIQTPFNILTTFLGNLTETVGWFWFFMVGCGFSLFCKQFNLIFYFLNLFNFILLIQLVPFASFSMLKNQTVKISEFFVVFLYI